MTLNHKTTKNHSAAVIFTLLLLLFVGPIIAAQLFYTHQNWLRHDTINSGQLIQPPLNFRLLHLAPLAQLPLNKNDLKDTWIMVYITPPPCTQICQSNLYKMRQVRLALGKEQNRVQRLLLIVSNSNLIHPDKNLFSAYPGMQYAQTTASAVTLQNALYLVDPHNNILMLYAPNAPAKGLLKDMTRLLDVSQIG